MTQKVNNNHMNIKTGVYSLLILSTLLATPVVFSQEIRQCSTTAVDPDGDGFGWEWNSEAGAMGSCEVTEDSTDSPSLVNAETGEQVQLIRPYWNANRDIAGRNIECKGYNWNRDVGRYTNEFAFYDSNLMHDPLPLSAPYMAYADYDNNPYSIWPDDVIYKIWTVIDGRYIGPMMGRSVSGRTAADWIEIIEATDTTPSGIRVWGGPSSPAYRECFDKSGASFGPTGFIGEELQNEETPNRSLIATGAETQSNGEPIVNLESGQPVELTTAYWDVYQSFWGRTISCWPAQWDGNSYYPEYSNLIYNSFYAVRTGEQRGFVATRFGLGGGDGGTNDEWRVLDGRLSVLGYWGMTIHDKVEIIPATDSAPALIRSWHSSESYTTCVDSGGLVGPYQTEDRKDLIPLDPASVQLQPESQTPSTEDSSTDSTNLQGIDDNSSPDTNNGESDSNNPDSSGGGAPTISLLMILLTFLVVRLNNHKNH